MKKCTKCNEELSIENFPIINKKTGKISSMCHECKKEYDREYWAKNKEQKLENKRALAKINRDSKRKYILDILQNNECMDCNNKDWRVLEFDHRDRETKLFNIADSLSYSIDKIQKEIDKCDIVCSNCHIIRTIKQRGYYKFNE